MDAAQCGDLQDKQAAGRGPVPAGVSWPGRLHAVKATRTLLMRHMVMSPTCFSWYSLPSMIWSWAPTHHLVIWSLSLPAQALSCSCCPCLQADGCLATVTTQCAFLTAPQQARQC